MYHHLCSERGIFVVLNCRSTVAFWIIHSENLLPRCGHVAVDSFGHRYCSRISARNGISSKTRRNKRPKHDRVARSNQPVCSKLPKYSGEHCIPLHRRGIFNGSPRSYRETSQHRHRPASHHESRFDRASGTASAGWAYRQVADKLRCGSRRHRNRTAHRPSCAHVR